MTPDIAANLARIRDRIAAAAQRAGRDPAAITLVAVTKTHPAEVVRRAAEAGLTDVGENRVEEALPKMAEVALPQLRWHLIGHLQSRKARAALEAGFHLIHSVDSVKLAERLNRFAQELGRFQPILLECNVSGEASKAGFEMSDPTRWAEHWPDIEQILALPNLRLRGLMTIAPLLEKSEQARPYFARLRELSAACATQFSASPETWRELSMGMTDDFEAAIAEGATLVRMGRALFGERR
jgi:pyridoxal phosphate enzyme (YggS family)